MLSLIDEIEQRRKVSDGNDNLYLGDIMAFRGQVSRSTTKNSFREGNRQTKRWLQFDDAARAYSAGGRPDLAVKLFTDMRRFKQAEQWASGDEQKRGLLELRAGWAEKEEDKGEAIELFLQLGKWRRH